MVPAQSVPPEVEKFPIPGSQKEREYAAKLLREILSRFMANREKSASIAYRALQQDLLRHGDFFVSSGLAPTLDKFIQQIKGLEEYIGADAGSGNGGGGMETLAAFLRGDISVAEGNA